MLSRYLLTTVAATALLIGEARADSTVAAMTAASALAGPELFYCVQTAADRNCTATQLKTFITSSGVVTSVGFSVPATSIFTATGSPVTGAGTLGFTTTGTSGGIPYFSSAAALSSSGALTSGAPILGGAPPTSGTVSGNTTKFATVNVTTFVSGNCVQVDASSNLTTAAAACGTGGGIVFPQTVSGTTSSGGIPYFSSPTVLSSSGALTANVPILGGSPPTSGTVSGNTTKFATVNTTTFATGQCVQVDASLNLTTTGSACGGGGGTPGGSTLQVQYNNAGAFGGANVYVESANVLALRNLSTAQSFYVYNTTDAGVGNYERGVFDWTTTLNTLTIGTQALGTGTGRNVALLAASHNVQIGTGTDTVTINGTTPAVGNTAVVLGGAQEGISLAGGSIITWAVGGWGGGTSTNSLWAVTSKVIGFGSGGSGSDGWHQWAGETRATANTSITSSTALVPVTGLAVNVQAGRTYGFQAELSGTWAAAGGVRAAIAGTATATNIVYDGWIVDSAANGIKGNAQSAALAGVVANAATTGTAGHVTISGAITVNAAGTLLVQAAQSASSGTSTIILQGSTFFVWDMP